MREGKSKRAVMREEGIHWTTLEKMLAHGSPPGYRMSGLRSKPKLGPYLDRIEATLAVETRKAFIGKYADSPTLILGTHFAPPTACRIVREGNSHRARFLGE